MIETINPLSGQVLRKFKFLPDEEIERVIAKAVLSQSSWNHIPVSQRASYLNDFAAALRQDQDRFARQMAIEIGKPIKQGLLEVDKCARTLEYFAEISPQYFSPKKVEAQFLETVVCPTPMGVLLGVMPWNFPLWQVIRFIAPALMAGNVILLKHAEEVQGLAEMFDKLIQAVFPIRVLHNLCVSKESVTSLIADPRVKGLSFTGSTETGRKLAIEAGRALKKGVFELGGNDPSIVFPDANIQLAAEKIVKSRFQNSGQSCIATKRVIVHSSVRKKLLDSLIEEMQKIQVGDPLSYETELGPLVAPRFVEQLEHQLRQQLSLGNSEVLYSHAFDASAFPGSSFFLPTLVFCKIWDGPLWFDETFGPLLGVFEYDDWPELIQELNSSDFALGVSLFTENRDRFKEISKELDFGCVVRNNLVSSDPRVPFSGRKQSGHGVELGLPSLFEFCSWQVVGQG